MNWTFWKKQATEGNGGATTIKLDKPKELPDEVGRKMVVTMKLDPDLVWSLKYVSRPLEGRPKTREFRIFNPATVNRAGVVVKNWTSFDDRPELVMYSGYYDKSSSQVEIQGAK
jgi:hypothetical protein